MREWYHERVPGIVPWVVPSIWNYTGVDGRCAFHLGAGHSYLFLLQKDEVIYYEPYSIGKSNAIHYMATIFPNGTRNIRIKFVLPDGMPSIKSMLSSLLTKEIIYAVFHSKHLLTRSSATYGTGRTVLRKKIMEGKRSHQP